MPRVLKPLGFIALGWLLSTAAAELAFRLAGDRPSEEMAHLYRAFVDGDYQLAPNIDTGAALPTGRITVHTDALGLRCDTPRAFALAPGASLDVLLLGDSQGFGNGVSFPDSLAGSTAVAANSAGHRVANAAIGGHTAASQLRLAEWLHRAQRLTPAHYVLLVTPAFAQSADHFSRAYVGDDGRLYSRKPDRFARLFVWAKTHLAAYGRIRDAARHGAFGSASSATAPFVFHFYDSAREASLHDSFTRYVARFAEFAATHGARVHVVYVPLTLELDFAPLRAAAAPHGLLLDRDVPFRVARAAARDCNVSFTDLRPVLESLHARHEPLHLTGDFHYNATLSQACGRRLWESLQPAVSRVAPFVSLQR